jgi:hypothetical protein
MKQRLIEMGDIHIGMDDYEFESFRSRNRIIYFAKFFEISP